MLKLSRYKEVGLCLVLVSQLLLSACSSSPKANLEVAGSVGTYVQQVDIGLSETVLGTAFIFKLRTGQDIRLVQDATLTISGPPGWNGDRPYILTYPARSDWVIASEVEVAPSSGVYQVEAVMDDQTVQQQFELTDIAQRLETTEVTATLVKEENSSIVGVSWSPVPGADGYFARLFDGTSGTPVQPDIYTLGTTAQFEVGVSTEDDYIVAVYSTTVDTVADDPALPAQFNLSDSIAVVTLEDSETNLGAQDLRRTMPRPSVTAKP